MSSIKMHLQHDSTHKKHILVGRWLQTSALNRKEKDAPRARPIDRNSAITAPAVSASCGATFLWREGTATVNTG